MNREQIASTVRGIVANACSVAESRLEEDTSLQAVGLDSVRAYEMVVEIEAAFDVDVPPEHLDDLAGAAMGDVVRLVESLIVAPNEEIR